MGIGGWVVGFGDWVVELVIGLWETVNGVVGSGLCGFGFGGSLGGGIRSVWVYGYGFDGGGVIGF